MPTSNAPPSIGDKLKNLKLVVEEYQLPTTRVEVLALIKRILEQGGVQKFQVQLGSPVRVHRYVKSDDLGPIKELEDENLFNAARNAPVDEYESIPGDPFRLLFEVFQAISAKGVVPKAVMVNNMPGLKKWLRLPATLNLKDLFGVEVSMHTEIPEDVGLLVCASPDDLSVVAYTLKFFLDEPPRPAKKGKK